MPRRAPARTPRAPSLPRRSPTQRVGDVAEATALRFLQARGLQLLARNVSSPLGEIDLVLRDGEQWVFVEVRMRRSDRFGGALASVTPSKQRRVRLQAQRVLKSQFGDQAWPACRFDVCAVHGEQVDWVRDAF
ncbi:MAG: YraN family protein [Burkholderiaceae bacterium]